jgi:hypothetical protein
MTVAHHSEVAFIEKTEPMAVRMSAADYTRVERLVTSIVPSLQSLDSRMHWIGTSRDLYDRRMDQTIEVCGALQLSFREAAKALNDYATALDAAKPKVADGAKAEVRLADLLASIGRGNRYDPVRHWQDLRGTDGFWDWLSEAFDQDEINGIRGRADIELNTAMTSFGAAWKIEHDARLAAIDALERARKSLPDLLASAADVQRIIDQTPGLRDDIRRAADDPFSRRPVGALEYFQVMADSNTGEPSPEHTVMDIMGTPVHLTKAEAAILQELTLAEQVAFLNLRAEAMQTANANYPPIAHGSIRGNDDHTDAFRHAYWNARMTQLYGPDWAERYATAHETDASNPGPREAMDLHNNQIGRQIALEHPNASPAELQALIRQAVERGDLVVINPQGELTYSDQLRPTETVNSDTLGGNRAPQPGRIPVPQPKFEPDPMGAD